VEGVHSHVGKLLHLCEVVRPGVFFLRRILIYLGVPPIVSWKGGDVGILRDGGSAARACHSAGSFTMTWVLEANP